MFSSFEESPPIKYEAGDPVKYTGDFYLFNEKLNVLGEESEK
jgi:hypothetical protein